MGIRDRESAITFEELLDKLQERVLNSYQSVQTEPVVSYAFIQTKASKGIIISPAITKNQVILKTEIIISRGGIIQDNNDQFASIMRNLVIRAKPANRSACLYCRSFLIMVDGL